MLERFKQLKGKQLGHDYHIDGEDLPDRSNRNHYKLITAGVIALVVVFFVNFSVVSLIRLIDRLRESNEAVSLFTLFEADLEGVFSVWNFISLRAPNIFFIIYLLLFIILGVWIYFKIDYGSDEEVAYGQKGDSRFTELDELKTQYKSVPNRPKDYPGINSFEGIGGVPISHYKNKYFIDTDTVNSVILGVSRSGKGETTITPMIDILSRAEIQSSMVLNDPKGELYASSKDTLEARGYDVQVLNLQDPMQSMSYNPLQLVIDAWLEGNPEEAAKRANSIAFTLYNDPNAGDNAFFNEGAQAAVVAIILALVEHAVEIDAVDKITMGNVVDMLNDLGTYNWVDMKEQREKNALDEWFKGLPSGHVAKKRYGATSFAGDKTRGSILATANTGLQPFVDPSFAKMTSRNSLDLKQVGFPKYLNGQLSSDLLNERVSISFHRNDEQKTLIKEYKVKVKAQGRFSLNFDEFDGGVVDEEAGLQDKDLILIKYYDEIEDKESKLIYRIHFEEQRDKHGNVVMQKRADKTDQPLYKREVGLECLFNSFEEVQSHLKMKYSNRPTAIFMIVPDYDSSNHALASIFTKQLYTELASNAVETKGNKCFKRVQYILDEFGNMPPIDDMDQVMTVCLGRNILFNIVLQSFTQLRRKYGDAADTIKENCQNLIYILSKNEDTIEEVSKAAGEKTDIAISSSQEHADMNNKINKSAEQTRLITPTRLRQLLEGEQLIIRSLKRQDLERKKVRPFPIFNTKKTVMPYRFQFLSEWIDTSKELGEIDIASEHATLNLKDVAVDMSAFIRDPKQQKLYQRKNNNDKNLINKESEQARPERVAKKNPTKENKNQKSQSNVQERKKQRIQSIAGELSEQLESSGIKGSWVAGIKTYVNDLKEQGDSKMKSEISTKALKRLEKENEDLYKGLKRLFSLDRKED